MGYTHYWTNKKRPTKKQWDAIMVEVSKLFETKEAYKLLRYESDKATPPRLDAEEIRFNGRGENGHETFYFTRDPSGFEFCKTARKPYDLFVTAVLTIAHHFAPDCFSVRSDGWPDEWQPAIDFLSQVSFEKYQVPDTIEARPEEFALPA